MEEKYLVERCHLTPLLEAGEAELVGTRIGHTPVFHLGLLSNAKLCFEQVPVTSPRQMGQVDSSGETGLPSKDLDFRFLLS